MKASADLRERAERIVEQLQEQLEGLARVRRLASCSPTWSALEILAGALGQKFDHDAVQSYVDREVAIERAIDGAHGPTQRADVEAALWLGIVVFECLFTYAVLTA
ncbi:MAG: hypothetical protein RIF41_24810 [Polyangiaceae bacterium]